MAAPATELGLSTKQIDSSILQLFWDLAALEPSKRQAAAAALVGHAVEAQAAATDTAAAAAVAADADDKERAAAALATCAPLAAYVLRRLCRGLGSGRDGARQGFATALTQALTVVTAVPLEHAFALLKSSLEPVTGASKGAEVNDSFFGQLFGLGAIIRALDARAAAHNNTTTKKAGSVTVNPATDANLPLRSALAEELVALAAKKSFLAEGAAALLVQLTDSLSASQLPQLLQRAPAFAMWLQAAPDSARPEVLVVLLKLLPKLPADVITKCPMLPAGVAADAAALFARAHLEALLPTLKATSAAHPRMHSLWGVLLARLVPGLEVTQCGRVLGSGKLKRKAPKANLARKAKKGKKEPSSDDDDSDEEEEREGEGGSSSEEEGDSDAAAASSLFVNPEGLVAAPEAEALWEVVVEQGLIPSSHERKYLAFELFARLLPYLPEARAAAVFSRGFMQCLVNNLAGKENYLHRRATQCAHTIVQYVALPSTGPRARVAVTTALQRFAGGRFDQLTGTQTVVKLLAAQDASSASLHLAELKRSFLSPPDADTAPAKRAWVVEQLAMLFRNQGTDPALCGSILAFLLRHGLFEAAEGGAAQPPPKTKTAKKGKKAAAAVEEELDAEPSPLLNADTREKCRARLLTLLAAASAKFNAAQHMGFGEKQEGKQNGGNKGGKGGKGAAAKEGGVRDLLAEMCDACVALQKPGSGVVLLTPLDAPSRELRARVHASLGDMRASAAGKHAEVAARARPFAALTEMLLIHHLAEPDEYTQVLEELPLVYEKLSAAGEDAAEEQQDEDGAPHPMDVLVDVILTLAAKPSAPLREAVERLFRTWCDKLTATGLRDMLRVLDRGNERSRARRKGSKRKGGGRDGGDGSDSESSSDDGEGSESEDDDVLQMEGDVEEEAGKEHTAGQESTDDDDDDDDDDRNAEDEDEEVKAAPAPAKSKAAKGGTKKEGSEEGSESEEEDLMDDDQMFAIDELLGRAFRSAQQDRNAAKATREALTHFKFRTCTLLDIFLRKHSSSPLLPGMLLPLLRALAAAHAPAPQGSAQLAARVAGLITGGVCKGRDMPSGGKAAVDVDAVKKALAKAAKLASRSSTKGVATAAAAGCHYLLRVLAAAAPPAFEAECQTVLKRMLTDFYQRKDCKLGRSFFEEAGRRSAKVRAVLLPMALPHVAAARTDFLVMEAVTLVATLLRQSAQAGGGEDATWVGHKQNAAAAFAAATAAVAHSYKKQSHRADALKSAAGICESLPKLCGGVELKQAVAVAPLVKALEKGYAEETISKVATQEVRLATLLGAKRRPPSAPKVAAAKKRKADEGSDDDEEEGSDEDKVRSTKGRQGKPADKGKKSKAEKDGEEGSKGKKGHQRSGIDGEGKSRGQGKPKGQHAKKKAKST